MKERAWKFCLTMEVWTPDSKTPAATEQIGVKSSGSVVHNRQSGGELIFAREYPATDSAALSAFGAKLRDEYRVRKWDRKYQVLLGGFRKWRFGGCKEYRTWRLEWKYGMRYIAIDGDILPGQAVQMRQDILALCEFELAPEIFFIGSDGRCALPTAAELLARLTG